ncbi:MAG: PadR family transcriptional regulator [Anaerolineaceae bacterium]|nr:PadR family transcriptional regulator [Anaerolineaceae bacterium]
MTNAETAILTLLAEQPRYGYEIEQIIAERGMREWTEIGFSSIYYLLKKLEREGLVSARLESEGGQGPARKVYRLTPAGQAALHETVLDILTHPRRVYRSLDLGIANLPGLALPDAIAALRQYCRELEERREHVRARWSRPENAGFEQVDWLFELSLTLIEAELGWVETLLGRLEAKADHPADGAGWTQ